MDKFLLHMNALYMYVLANSSTTVVSIDYLNVNMGTELIRSSKEYLNSNAFKVKYKMMRNLTVN